MVEQRRVGGPPVGHNGNMQTPTETSADGPRIGHLQGAARAVVLPVFKVFWRIEVTGRENLPATGPAILCPNHTSVLDSFMLPATLPRRITFVGKAEYLDDWKTRYLFPGLGMIPIDRTGGDAAERALSTAARLLDAGQFFGIYPEGTRSRDGVLHKGHTGPARLALRTGAPIIPVGLRGMRDIQPPDARFPKPFRRAEVHFGRPIDPTPYLDRADDRTVLRQIIDQVMYEIRALSGQDYVHEYATKPTTPAHERVPTIDVDLPERRSSTEVLRAPALV